MLWPWSNRRPAQRRCLAKVTKICESFNVSPDVAPKLKPEILSLLHWVRQFSQQSLGLELRAKSMHLLGRSAMSAFYSVRPRGQVAVVRAL